MFHRHLIHKTVQLGAGGVAIAILTMASPARGASPRDKRACAAPLSTYKSAVDREKAGHQREARDLLLSCADATACAGLASKCRAKYVSLGLDMPSIVPLVSDDEGVARVDVEVRIDGQLLISKLDGKALPVEAGFHEFTFTSDGRVFDTEKLMIAEGQRNRLVQVTVHSPERSPDKVAQKRAPAASEAVAPTSTARASADRAPSAEATPDDSSGKADRAAPDDPSPVERSGGGGFAFPRSPLPYVLGGIGLAGIGAGALLTFWGKKDNDELQAGCGQTGTCQQSSVDHIRTLYIASDISIGAGVLALGVATWMFATSRSTEDKPAPRAAYTFDVHPTRSGAFASVAGAF